MKRQVFVIHGGECFETREACRAALTNWKVTLEDLSKKGWKKTLPSNLSHFDVYLPEMPNKLDARYAEWKIWFDKFVPEMRDDLVLVGHSLGGIFLVKYLAENVIGKKIASLHLVAAPFYPSAREYFADFDLPASLAGVTAQVGHVYLYFSRDDAVVDFGDSERYLAALPGSKLCEFSDRGHFNQESFPELIAHIS